MPIPRTRNAAVETNNRNSDITLHQTVKDFEDGTKSMAVTGTSLIEYRCGLYSGRTCAASVVVLAFVSSG